MSRVRTYVVGRDRACDVPLDDSSVSRRHAEVVRLAGGRLYVTDCATTNGTFVLDGGAWRAIRQAFVEPTGRIRFGDREMTIERLGVLCPGDGARPAGGADALPARAGAPPGSGTPDSTLGLERDPETGEVMEKEPRRSSGRRSDGRRR